MSGSSWDTALPPARRDLAPELDGMWQVQHDPFNQTSEIVNSTQRTVQIYAQNTGPDPSTWWEARTCFWFDTEGLEVRSVAGFRWHIRGLVRHLVDPGMAVVPVMYEGHAPLWGGDPAIGIIDVQDVKANDNWYSLNGKPGIGPPLTFSRINDLIVANGGATDGMNTLFYTEEQAEAGGGILLDMMGADESRILTAIDSYDGAGFGIVVGMATSAPGILDTANYPNAGADPSNRVLFWDIWALVEVTEGLVEISARQALTVAGNVAFAPLAAPEHELRGHRSVPSRNRRQQPGGTTRRR